MTRPVTSEALAPAICKALGIEVEHVSSIRIDLCAGKAVQLTVERFVQEPEGDALIPVLSLYKLVPADELP